MKIPQDLLDRCRAKFVQILAERNEAIDYLIGPKITEVNPEAYAFMAGDKVRVEYRGEYEIIEVVGQRLGKAIERGRIGES